MWPVGGLWPHFEPDLAHIPSFLASLTPSLLNTTQRHGFQVHTIQDHRCLAAWQQLAQTWYKKEVCCVLLQLLVNHRSQVLNLAAVPQCMEALGLCIVCVLYCEEVGCSCSDTSRDLRNMLSIR